MTGSARPLVGAVGVAAAIGAVGLLWHRYKATEVEARRRELLQELEASIPEEETEQAGLSDANLSAQVREHSQHVLRNIMITYKREHPQASFEEFIRDVFPENLTRNARGELECDERVRCDAWEGAYMRTRAADPLRSVGPVGGQF